MSSRRVSLTTVREGRSSSPTGSTLSDTSSQLSSAVTAYAPSMAKCGSTLRGFHASYTCHQKNIERIVQLSEYGEQMKEQHRLRVDVIDVQTWQFVPAEGGDDDDEFNGVVRKMLNSPFGSSPHLLVSQPDKVEKQRVEQLSRKRKLDAYQRAYLQKRQELDEIMSQHDASDDQNCDRRSTVSRFTDERLQDFDDAVSLKSGYVSLRRPRSKHELVQNELGPMVFRQPFVPAKRRRPKQPQHQLLPQNAALKRRQKSLTVMQKTKSTYDIATDSVTFDRKRLQEAIERHDWDYLKRHVVNVELERKTTQLLATNAFDISLNGGDSDVAAEDLQSLRSGYLSIPESPRRLLPPDLPFTHRRQQSIEDWVDDGILQTSQLEQLTPAKSPANSSPAGKMGAPRLPPPQRIQRRQSFEEDAVFASTTGEKEHCTPPVCDQVLPRRSPRIAQRNKSATAEIHTGNATPARQQKPRGRREKKENAYNDDVAQSGPAAKRRKLSSVTRETQLTAVTKTPLRSATQRGVMGTPEKHNKLSDDVLISPSSTVLGIAETDAVVGVRRLSAGESPTRQQKFSLAYPPQSERKHRSSVAKDGKIAVESWAQDTQRRLSRRDMNREQTTEGFDALYRQLEKQAKKRNRLEQRQGRTNGLRFLY